MQPHEPESKVDAQPRAESEGRVWEVLRVLYRHRFLFLAVFASILVVTAILTAAWERQYESSATLVLTDEPEITKAWLESRQAAELVVEELGLRLEGPVFPGGANASWPAEKKASELLGHISVKRKAAFGPASNERVVLFTAKTPDPEVSRAIVAAFLGTLGELRPLLEDLTRQEAFDRYYRENPSDQSEAEAERRADNYARQRTYWLVLDEPAPALSPSEPRVVFNFAVGAVGGLMAAFVAVFGVDWIRGQRRRSGNPSAGPR
ncbi:MAG: hypothetical protein HYT80_09515 [Euryarchaeota archaeon]|nr:hypothetical protein [Euryarchaeota archaeon]